MALRSWQRVSQSVKFWNLKPSNTQLLCASSHNVLKNYSRTCMTEKCYEDKDPAPVFFNTKIQNVLKSLTGLNIEKVFKNRHLENPNLVEEYKFLTKEDLKENIDQSLQEAKRLLQMPPVLKEREPRYKVLSSDPAIRGAETARMIFTDISYGVSDRKRIIVVREPDGTLREASWEERDRMNQIYNPRPGRFHKVPPIFQEEFLKDALNREEYTFVLDLACAHLEPDDPLYHEVTRSTYEHIKKRSRFQEIHSTRHFGPMCFYFAWNRKIDNLLIHYIQEERLKEGSELVSLFYLIHNPAKARAEEDDKAHMDIIKKYVEEDAVIRPNLELALQVYEETLRERETLENTIKSSHGIS